MAEKFGGRPIVSPSYIRLLATRSKAPSPPGARAEDGGGNPEPRAPAKATRRGAGDHRHAPAAWGRSH